MEPKALLILGGSNCQMSAFRLALRRGIPTLLFDFLTNPPAKALADRHIQVSTFDVEACVAAAEALPLKGVMTLGTDQPVYTAACIAERLGLPSLLDVETAASVTNKAIMKQLFVEHGIPSVPSMLVDGHALPSVPFTGPVVLKPVDSQGQRGVLLAKDLAEARSLLPEVLAHSRQPQALCEAYYPSSEITLSAWVHQDQVHPLTVTDRRTFPHPRHIGVCSAHCFPSRAARGHMPAIHALAQQIARAFGIGQGPLYIQMLLGSQGVLVNEVACRIGGAFEDVFIPKVTGFDILAAVVDSALGQDIVPPEARPPQGCVREIMLFTKPGRIHTLTPLAELLALPFVLDAGYQRSIGWQAPDFQNAGARLGHAVLWAPDEASMGAALNTFYQVFHVQNQAGEDLLLTREE